jgi:predicted transcriptional regulator
MMTSRTFRLDAEVLQTILELAEAQRCSQGMVIARAVNMYREKGETPQTQTESVIDDVGGEIL